MSGSTIGKSVICWFGTIDVRFTVANLLVLDVGGCIEPPCPANGHTLEPRWPINKHALVGSCVVQIATADTWYQTSTRDQGVTHIVEPHIVEFYRCNLWHVRGRNQDLLVDSGMGVVSLREQIPLLSERPLTAVATHTHFDHIGAHYEFKDRAVHHKESRLLAHPTRENTAADKYVTNDIFTQLPPASFRAADYAVKSAPATRIVADGDIIDLGDRHFEVLHTPGHSPGSISLWEKSTGILFSGDVVYDGELIDGEYPGYAEEYLQSLERLLELPVTVVHGGHFPSYGLARHKALIKGWLERLANGQRVGA